MFAIGRRQLVLGASALALAGCGGGGSAVGVDISPDDMVIGAENAPLTLLEYGSAMCGHCRQFHENSWETLKTEYIDAGKVRFIFREALAPVSQDGSGTIESITLAEYQVARCAAPTPAQYFDRLSVLFEQQQAVFAAGTMDRVREKLFEFGGAANLSRDQVSECISDPAGAQRIARLGAAFTRDGTAAGLTPREMGTPMFFLNGAHVDTDDLMSPEALRRLLDAAATAGG